MRLILFPGLAADARMFEPQRRVFPLLETPDWPAPLRNESLDAYCDRLAQSLHLDGGPVVVGGVSFGGMVAQILAPKVQAAGVVLIATWRPGDPMPPGGAALMRLAGHLPIAWLEWFFHRPAMVERFQPMDAETRALLLQMLDDADMHFVRWAIGAMARFPATADLPKLWRLHGREDKVLPPPEDDQSCRFIEGAGHCVSATHADETNAFIAECLHDVWR